MASKYILIDTVVFDYILFPIFTHNGDDTLPKNIEYLSGSGSEPVAHSVKTTLWLNKRPYNLIISKGYQYFRRAFCHLW